MVGSEWDKNFQTRRLKVNLWKNWMELGGILFIITNLSIKIYRFILAFSV